MGAELTNGKGDKQRPTQIPPDEMAERWARTFGKAEPKPETGRT